MSRRWARSPSSHRMAPARPNARSVNRKCSVTGPAPGGVDRLWDEASGLRIDCNHVAPYDTGSVRCTHQPSGGSMDHGRFDQIARAISQNLSRRTLAGVIGLGAMGISEVADAKKNKKKVKKNEFGCVDVGKFCK